MRDKALKIAIYGFSALAVVLVSLVVWFIAPMLVIADIAPFRLSPMEPAEFSSLEEQVIVLAKTDGLGSIEAPSRIERFVKRLFGLNEDRRALADPRLEVLRRAVVVTRHRHHLPDMQAAELREAGYSVAQIRAIELKAAIA